MMTASPWLAAYPNFLKPYFLAQTEYPVLHGAQTGTFFQIQQTGSNV